MKDISYYSSIIEKSIAELNFTNKHVPGLYDPVTYTLSGGGKRLRPVLVLMACEAVGGKIEDAVDAAVGIEMFHNFTLLHDDVMDNSDVRRGRPTVHARWDMNTAILSGDAMLTLATQLVSTVSSQYLKKVLDSFNSGALDVYEGQALDMEFENRQEQVTTDEYLNMIRLKTGALLAVSCKIGAIIGGASGEVAKAFYDYGMDLGVAFQIHDDYLDLYGDAATFGKPIGGDIQNNKQTYLLVTAMSKGSEYASVLRQALKMERGENKITVFKEIYDAIGMANECRNVTEEYGYRAIKNLTLAGLSVEDFEKFNLLVHRLLDRQK